MNPRTLLMIGAAAGAVITTAIIFAPEGEAAPRTLSVQYDDAKTRWAHFNARNLGGGQMRLEPFCIQAMKLDGGVMVLEQPCGSCEGAIGAALIQGCIDSVKAANGLQ